MALRYKKIEILISEKDEAFLRDIYNDLTNKHGNVDTFLSETINALDNDCEIIVTDVNPRLLKKEKKYGNT